MSTQQSFNVTFSTIELRIKDMERIYNDRQVMILRALSDLEELKQIRDKMINDSPVEYNNYINKL